MRSFVEIKSSHDGEITLSITDIGKACHSPEFQMSLICLLTLFAKIKFWRKNPRIYSMFSMTRYRSKVLLVAILIPLCDLEIKVTDLDFSYMSDFFLIYVMVIHVFTYRPKALIAAILTPLCDLELNRFRLFIYVGFFSHSCYVHVGLKFYLWLSSPHCVTLR